MRRPGITPATAEAIVARQPWETVAPLLARAGADPAAVIPLLKRFAIALVTWNASVSNLISRNDVARLVDRHVRESLEPAELLSRAGCRSWIDFGSGAGFPAIPLALAGIGERWQLVESRRPKTLFLRKVMQDIGLPGVSVTHDRIENVEGDASFDGFTARATERIAPTLVAAARHIRPGGKVFLWKGSGWAVELARTEGWRESWEQEATFTLLSTPIVVVVFVRK